MDSPTKEVSLDSKDGAMVFDTPRLSAVAVAKKEKQKSWLHFLACCVTLFSVGWSDGTAGPLLPRMQQYYKVNDITVSLIFIVNALGCIAAAGFNVMLSHRIDFGKLIVGGAAVQLIAFALQAPALPFPVFVISYFISGFGLALQDALANSFVASLKTNGTTKMGIIHACYGAGALAAPLVSTQFAQMPHWSFHFIISAGLGLSTVLFDGIAFRFRSHEACLVDEGQLPEERDENEVEEVPYKQIIRTKAVFLLAAYLLCYVGTEVTMGNWSVTYIIRQRGGGGSSGYVSAGFFGGLTVGRIILLPVNAWIGEELATYIYVVISIGLQLIVWLVPSLIAGAVCISLIGVILGPLFPIAMNVAGRTIPTRILSGSIGLMAAFSASGAAIVPFITGAIAEAAGIWSLQPILVALLVGLLGLWMLIPKRPRGRTVPAVAAGAEA